MKESSVFSSLDKSFCVEIIIFYPGVFYVARNLDAATRTDFSSSFGVKIKFDNRPVRCTNLHMKNNIFYQAGLGYAYYIPTSAQYLDSDYNDIFAPNCIVGYYYGNLPTLIDFQTATGTDSNSISADPFFLDLSSPDLHINTLIVSPVDSAGIPVTTVAIDIDGDVRDVVSPDIGVDEFAFTTHDYYVSLEPDSQYTVAGLGDTTNEVVQIYNYGSQNDVYDLSVSVISGEPWQTELWDKNLTSQMNSIAVLSWAVDTIIVRIAVPGSAISGESSSADIIASSRYGTARDALSDTAWINTTALPLLPFPYSENFDTNDGGYDPKPAGGCWEWGEPIVNPSSAYSPPNCWGIVLNGNYSSAACCQLTTPPITLEPMSVLTFYYWVNIEWYYDGGNVKISTDGGVNWDLITPNGGYPVGAVNTGNACIPGEPAYSGNSGGWVLATFDLSAYGNETVFFRWEFGSDYSDEYQGWYIDDVSVFVPPAPAVEDLVVTLSNSTDDSTNIILIWSPAQNAQQYHIYKSTTDPNMGFVLLSSTSDTFYTDTSAVVGGTKSFYYITSDNTLLDRGILQRISP